MAVITPRAGAQILILLANPLHGKILRAHEDGPPAKNEVHRRTGWPPDTTLRRATKSLREAGLIQTAKIKSSTRATTTELTEAGHEALFVVNVIERWLVKAPRGGIVPFSDEAKAAIKALAEGWSSTVIWEIATNPASLAELTERITWLSYPSLERRVTKLRSARQIDATGEERNGRYEATPWLRQGVAVLAAAVRCERRHMAETTAPVTAKEIEAGLMLAIPILPLPPDAEGRYVLSATPETESRSIKAEAAGVEIELKKGKIVRINTELDKNPATWVLGAPTEWLDSVIDGKVSALRISRGPGMKAVAGLVKALHLTLFGPEEEAKRQDA